MNNYFIRRDAKMKDKKKNIFDYKDDEMTFIESDIEKIQ